MASTTTATASPSASRSFGCSGATGIKLHDREDHAAYLANWLQTLRSDKRAIFAAATQAQAAADWLLSSMAIETAAEMEQAA